MSASVNNNTVPRLFDEAIERRNTELPDDYMPSAPAALVASEEVVRHATEDCPPISPRRRWRSSNYKTISGWQETEWINIEPNCSLVVWRCGNLWHVGRRIASRQICAQALGFVFGPAPICTHTREEAMRLAEYYHLTPTEAAGGFQWVDLHQQ